MSRYETVRSQLDRALEVYGGQDPAVTAEMRALWSQWLDGVEDLLANAPAGHGDLRGEDFQRHRERIAEAYLRGSGIEIGALCRPQPVAEGAQVRYVDRLNRETLEFHYFELKGQELVAPDIEDDGEVLAKVADQSQDFVIASHMLEHCENPILAIQNQLRVLRPGGIAFFAVPDKRYTFDEHRPRTDLDHLWRDYREGPAWSRPGHFREWAVHLSDHEGDALEAYWRLLDGLGYSIHYHVWESEDVLALFEDVRRQLDLRFEIVEFTQQLNECALILRQG